MAANEARDRDGDVDKSCCCTVENWLLAFAGLWIAAGLLGLAAAVFLLDLHGAIVSVITAAVYSILFLGVLRRNPDDLCEWMVAGTIKMVALFAAGGLWYVVVLCQTLRNFRVEFDPFLQDLLGDPRLPPSVSRRRTDVAGGGDRDGRGNVLLGR